MPADQLSPQPRPSQSSTVKPSPYTLISLGIGVAGTALMIGLAASHQADKVAAVFGAWAFWLPIALLSGTRTLWDRGFVGGGTRLQRIRAFLGEWVGYVGILTAAALIVLSVNFHDSGIHPRLGWWLVPEIAIPLAMIWFGGVARRCGIGILIALAAPLWPYLLFGAVVILGPPAVLYLITLAISHGVAAAR
ncbi:hypothetical protein HLB23_36495 [Nocardia uniformis]|uniref:Uncharacterized protein n=1 Tax=Nocardia uniformis TaxID=53432 RepID=A0A849CK63_9NOCA|nr:hypothetical protein [Nocardia uniformis]NNH75291.1 hypothetical protein [Nocardia uniformis]